MAKTGGGREECAHDSHLTRAVDARHAARSYEAGLEPCVSAISTLATRPRCVRKTRFRSRARASERRRARRLRRENSVQHFAETAQGMRLVCPWRMTLKRCNAR